MAVVKYTRFLYKSYYFYQIIRTRGKTLFVTPFSELAGTANYLQ